jgi:hypothetical protein
MARETYGEAAVIIHQLAETIDEDALRVGVCNGRSRPSHLGD